MGRIKRRLPGGAFSGGLFNIWEEKDDKTGKELRLLKDATRTSEITVDTAFEIVKKVHGITMHGVWAIEAL